MSSETVNILHVLPGGAYFGGTERYLYNYYQKMNHGTIHFDFIFAISNSMKIVQDHKIFNNSAFSEMHLIKEERNRLSDWIRYTKALRKHLKENSYDIVEIQTASIFILFFSALSMIGIKTRKIAHTHSMHQEKGGKIGKLIFAVERWIIDHSYNCFFSCSKVAGVALFGERIVRSSCFYVIPNAIDTEAFKFDVEKRKEIRQKYGISDDELIIGHIARLSKEKNQLFLIDVFFEIKKKYEHTKLWIIGDGDYRSRILERIHESGIKNSVELFGQIEDIRQYLQAMDAFVIPSFREGLCISAIESQANGLPTFVSDGIPEECNVSRNFHCIALSKSAVEWAKEILDFLNGSARNEVQILDKDYDIHNNSRMLQQIYINLA